MIGPVLSAASLASFLLIIVGVGGGVFCFFQAVYGYYEALLPGICCWMAALMELNGLFACHSSFAQFIAADLVDIGLVFSVCVFLYRLRKKEEGEGCG